LDRKGGVHKNKKELQKRSLLEVIILFQTKTVAQIGRMRQRKSRVKRPGEVKGKKGEKKTKKGKSK